MGHMLPRTTNWYANLFAGTSTIGRIVNPSRNRVSPRVAVYPSMRFVSPAVARFGGIVQKAVSEHADVGDRILSERRAFDRQHVLGVRLGRVREVVRAGDHRVVDDQELVVHEVVR